MAGLGQKTYREWLTNVRKDAREMGEFSMEVFYNRQVLDEHYQQFLLDLQLSLEENNNLNTHMWIDRAEQEVERIKEILIAKFNIPDDEDNPIDEEDVVFVETNEDSILGFPVLTGLNYHQLKAGGAQRRAQISLSLGELAEYLRPIPQSAIKAIELILDQNDEIVGYRVWVGDTT